MVEHVIVARMGEHRRRRNLTKQVQSLAIGRFVEDDVDVPFSQAVVGRSVLATNDEPTSLLYFLTCLAVLSYSSMARLRLQVSLGCLPSAGPTAIRPTCLCAKAASSSTTLEINSHEVRPAAPQKT